MSALAAVESLHLISKALAYRFHTGSKMPVQDIARPNMCADAQHLQGWSQAEHYILGLVSADMVSIAMQHPQCTESLYN